MSDEVMDFELCYRDTTEKSFLLAETETSRASYFPKSLIEVNDLPPFRMNQVVNVTMPEWLAAREGLI